MQGLSIFVFRIRVGHDPAAAEDGELIARRHGGPDEDVQLHAAVVPHVPEAAAIDAAATRLQLVDDLHRTNPWCAGDRSSGQRGAQQVDTITALLETPLYLGNQVVDRGV